MLCFRGVSRFFGQRREWYLLMRMAGDNENGFLFSSRTSRPRNKYHTHHLDAWYSSTNYNTRSFPTADAPSDVLPPNYNLGLLKGRINAGRITSLKAGNASVAPLVLQMFMWRW
ncbi:jg21146 [Pararge aegeria aegeria]|uniref:Jg21146 protein n=1 Tax=Pararge aegeria aegeria TaxID=348720 RepID=A0A8S4SK76_9NEOP|nr:jg21146 [Pararge aegeria aegeria]